MIPITGKTKLLGVIGYPIEHSLSPLMHNAAISHLNLDYVYLPFPIKPEFLPQAIAGFTAINLVAFNVTIPHKQTIIPLLTKITPTAKMVGAVNTVWYSEKGWCGTNTDIAGFISPLKRIAKDWTQVTPVILGHGGAARAVIVGCSELGCPKIHVLGRNPDKLVHFFQSWQDTPIHRSIEVHSWNKLPELVSETQLLVNTTPVGMYPNFNQSPVSLEILSQLKPETIVYDLIYTPNPTLLLQQAKQQGLVIIDGLEMLVQQGATALEMWLKQPVPIDIMSQTLKNHLGLN
jgi:shikimate dehydrogenase